MISILRKNKGFSLIEILVTMGVLSIGILGVATLHTVISKQSLDNKARAEALAIAQSRIEEMRNYTNEAGSLDEFNVLYADTNGFANTVALNGINAVFSRSESISSQGDLKQVNVRVSWTTPDDEAQQVNLNTELSFVSPRRTADTALGAAPRAVNAPTGRARLGEGVLPEGAVTVPNQDGTSLFQDGGTDLMLVSDDQIVLTLAQACQTDTGECIDFVKIKGRIWIDVTSQSNLTPGQVYIVASDAAFCARYYEDQNGNFQVVTHNTTGAMLTPSGNYRYFNYTCYIGGGWHGNIGVLLGGGLSQSDKICVGDPNASQNYGRPIIASRRVYRGMLWRYDPPGSNNPEMISGTNLIRYYSQGIANQTELPEPDSGQASHDFVIGSMQQNLTAGSNCVSQGVMVRPDSNVNGVAGDLFAGIPADFFCLNRSANGTQYLDDFDEEKFAVYQNQGVYDCPYNPADPPSSRHVVSGTVFVTAPNTEQNTLMVNSVFPLTSDGPANCQRSAFSHTEGSYFASYACDVFDWGNGWSGYIEVLYDASNMSCTPNRLNFSGVNSNRSNNHFNNCSPGSFAVFSGTVTAAGNRTLTAVSISGGGSCQLANSGLSYTCVTSELAGGTWTGTISFTPSGGTVCSPPNHNGVFSYSNLQSGFYTRNVDIRNNANQC